MNNLCLRRAVPILAWLGICLWTAMPSFGAEVPERLGERQPGLAGLAPDQAAEVQSILDEHAARLAALAGHPGAVQEMWKLQNEILERLGAVLTPEELAQLRASMPAFSMLDRVIASRAASGRAGSQKASPAACSDGYNDISAGRDQTELACSDGNCDYNGHGAHNPYSVNDALVNCQARDAAADAEALAYLALTNCSYADDAANAAATAAAIAADGATWAQQAEIYCANLGHPNACAHNAYLEATLARALLEDGAASETACFSCCFTLAAPTGLFASATNATTIRLTWQDPNSNETHTKIERNTNAAGWVEIASVGVNVKSYADGGGASTGGHRYRVRAFSSTCNLYSSYSAQALVPKAPTNLAGTRGTGAQYILNWRDLSGAINEQNFEIQRRIGTGSWELLKKVAADQTTYTATLVAGVNRFRVRATTSTGESWFTNEVSYTY